MLAAAKRVDFRVWRWVTCAAPPPEFHPLGDEPTQYASLEERKERARLIFEQVLRRSEEMQAEREIWDKKAIWIATVSGVLLGLMVGHPPASPIAQDLWKAAVVALGVAVAASLWELWPRVWKEFGEPHGISAAYYWAASDELVFSSWKDSVASNIDTNRVVSRWKDCALTWSFRLLALAGLLLLAAVAANGLH